MTSLRLLADDLTGALDSAAELVGLCGPVEIRWADLDAGSLPESLAVDSGTREQTVEAAAAIVARLAAHLEGASIAFKKMDSLARGPWASELAACLNAVRWPLCVVAPAFPHQGRRTIGGRQQMRDAAGGWREVGDDLVASLAAQGLAATRATPSDMPTAGCVVVDAATESDLDRIVAAGRKAAGAVLWCGTGGLARALARGHAVAASARVERPVLGLFGSDQPATAAQLAACEPVHLALAPGEAGAGEVARRLAGEGVAFVSARLPGGLSRDEAAALIGTVLGEAASGLSEPPRTLIVAGGETLKGLCATLGAASLVVTGQVEPGVPRSIMRGGRWDGVEVISKSGAFGAPGLWRDLLAANDLRRTNGPPSGRTP